MSLRSQTHKGLGFNELRFEDENGKQEVFIHAQKNMDIQVRNSKMNGLITIGQAALGMMKRLSLPITEP